MLMKPLIENFSPNDCRKLFSLQLPNTSIGKLDIKMKEYSLPRDMFVTELIDSNGNKLGSDIFGLSNEKDIFNYNIEIENPHKGKGLGELLRLTTIIEMIENKVEQIRLYSKNTAIYFHSKYKFEPNIKSFSHRNEALKNISNNKIFKPFAQNASEILEKIEKTDMFDYDKQCEHSRQANSIIKQYIQEVLQSKKQKELPFDIGFDMKLTKESILKNLDFFNNLLKKHGIDYQIKS